MSSVKSSLFFAAACLSLLLFPAVVFSQSKPAPSGEPQDVIKFETSLVQTDVMVFDKNGHFVDGLKPEQFQLKVDNTQREVSFFEAVRSGNITSQPQEAKSAEGQPKTINPIKSD